MLFSILTESHNSQTLDKATMAQGERRIWKFTFEYTGNLPKTFKICFNTGKFERFKNVEIYFGLWNDAAVSYKLLHRVCKRCMNYRRITKSVVYILVYETQ